MTHSPSLSFLVTSPQWNRPRTPTSASSSGDEVELRSNGHAVNGGWPIATSEPACHAGRRLLGEHPEYSPTAPPSEVESCARRNTELGLRCCLAETAFVKTTGIDRKAIVIFAFVLTIVP